MGLALEPHLQESGMPLAIWGEAKEVTKKPHPYEVCDYLMIGEVRGAQYSERSDGRPITSDDGPADDYILDQHIDIAFGTEACRYCGRKLAICCTEDRSDMLEEFYSLNLVSQSQIGTNLMWCNYCGYWVMLTYRSEYHKKAYFRHLYGSSLRRFPKRMPYSCATEIAAYLRKHPSFFNSITPRGLEHFVASVWRSNHGSCEVTHVGKPGDKGRDVIYVDGDKKDWLIQVKRRAHADSVEGFSTVQNLAGALIYHGQLHGIVVSTAHHFSMSARMAIDVYRNRGLIIDLVDKGKLNQMLDPMLPTTPWAPYLREDNPEHATLVSWNIHKQTKGNDNSWWETPIR